MAVKIQLYGQLKQIAGSSEILLDVKDTDELKRLMGRRFPNLHDIHYLIAVDRIIVQNNTAINEEKELALLPPYSGG
jgi:sulfur-carrier protein